jgi:hypothetical protein
VEGDVVVERDEEPGPGRAEPRQRVAADGEEHERHVELERLGGALGRGEAVAHDLERRHAPVLHELPHEQRRHGRQPQRQHPRAPPVLLRRHAHAPPAPPPPWTPLLHRLASDAAVSPSRSHRQGPAAADAEVLAPLSPAGRAQRAAVRHVGVALEEQRLQLPQLASGERDSTRVSTDEYRTNTVQ